MDKKKEKSLRVADHLANERTFLAWIRTSVGIMGFGFVVVKFSLFIREITIAIGSTRKIAQPGYSHLIGIMLVALGGVIVAFSFVRYLATRKQLDEDVYYHSDTFAKVITSLIFLICIVLLVYLLQTR
jgi:putative membrane protein